MTTAQTSELAINGGQPLSTEPILIHKPSINDDDIRAVADAMRSTFVSGDGPA